MRVHKTRQAEADLLNIWFHIAEHDISAADRLLDRVERRCTTLAQRPRLGAARPEIAPDAHSLVEGRYLILYRIVGQVIEIVRVVHGARDLATLFKRSGPDEGP